MGFVRQLATTGKVPISEEVRKEVEMTYFHSIVTTIENKKIPKSLVINLDQTPSKYVPGCNKTLAPKGVKNVSIAGSTDKRTITATFSITMDGQFLPMQIIYGGKTSKSIPRVSFPDGFLVSANPKHYSNEEESLKMMEHIIIPYVQQQRNTLKLDAEYPAMLLMDVFKGQMTNPVNEILKRNNIILQKVPANLTYLFQLLNVQGGPNGYAKRFMKKKFTLWYADQVQRAMDAGKSMEEIDIDLKLSVLKPLHASCLIELFDHMTSPADKAVSSKGWEVAGITDAVKKGASGLPSLDPFHDIDLFSFIPVAIEEDNSEIITGEQREMYLSEESMDVDDSDDEEWIDSDGNAFDAFDIDKEED